MFEAIVVDDELTIRKGISSFINNTDTGFEVLDTFKDGNEVIDFLADHKVDLIISDIKMVHVSGIELAKYVFENKPEIKMVLLSGYEEFEYARAAIRYNVKNYITKPTDFNELRNILLGIKDSLESELKSDINSFLESVKDLYSAVIADNPDEARSVFDELLDNNRHDDRAFGQYASNLFEIIFDRISVNLKINVLRDRSNYKMLTEISDRKEIKKYRKRSSLIL